MTEAEKRALAKRIMLQEQQRLSNKSFSLYSEDDIKRLNRNQALFASLAQQGITWKQLKAAYDEAFQSGHEAMLDHHLTYLYAGSAIAYHEAFDTEPEVTAAFVQRLAAIPEDEHDRTALLQKALECTGIDTSIYDDEGQEPNLRALSTGSSHSTRKDREAVARMKRTGITKADLEYERQLGYSNGWNSGFYFSACYATVAIALAEQGHGAQAETLIERLEELRYEEITTTDIIERAKAETGVDVSGMIRR